MMSLIMRKRICQRHFYILLQCVKKLHVHGTNLKMRLEFINV